VIALSTAMAGRTWIHPTEENVLFGADDVRHQDAESAEIEVAPATVHTLYALNTEGLLSEISVAAPALPDPPALSAWKTVAEPDYTAPEFDDTSWLPLDDLETQGNMIPQVGSNPYGWYRALVESPDAGDATLHFAACSDRLTLWVNGERIGSSAVPPEDRREDWTATFEITLREGTNTLCVLADGLGLIKGDWQIGKGQEHEKKGIYGPVTLTIGGACYLVDVARWHFRPFLYGEENGWWKPESFPGAEAATPAASPIRWHRATFTLGEPLDTATPLLVRLDGMGKGVLWLNGRNLGRYWQTAGPQRDYYAPEPWLTVGENVLVLAETEGNLPGEVTLVWDERSSAVVRVSLGG
jgi:hypothetical protein